MMKHAKILEETQISDFSLHTRELILYMMYLPETRTTADKCFFVFAFRLTPKKRSGWLPAAKKKQGRLIAGYRSLGKGSSSKPKMEQMMEYFMIFKCTPKTSNRENDLAIFDLTCAHPPLASSGPSVPVSLSRNLYYATYVLATLY